jgi:hypothetical protein
MWILVLIYDTAHTIFVQYDVKVQTQTMLLRMGMHLKDINQINIKWG